MSNGVIILIANLIAILGIVLPILAKYQMNLQASLTKRFEKIDERFVTLTKAYSDQALQINGILVGDIRELREKQKSHEERLREIEMGKTEWLRTLRKRTHGLSNDLHSTIVDLELLKQGKTTRPRQPRSLNEIDNSDAPGEDL